MNNFSEESFGMLVRPKTLTNMKTPQNLLLQTNIQSAFKKIPFSELSLGDTSKHDMPCYTAVIKELIFETYEKRLFRATTPENVAHHTQYLKKRLGNSTKAKVGFVGVNLYKDFTHEDGKLKALDCLSETVLYYYPWDIAKMSNVLIYDSIRIGTLVFRRKQLCMVVKKTRGYEREFFKTNSWSPYNIQLLHPSGKNFIKITPNWELEIYDEVKYMEESSNG